ncbi:YdcF family protein [Marinicauda salina]|uniref:YdcF family protein n=1 Tax=Marinicauda salina TaxID=2135793 RepID=A0A2U2BQR9_9PROT|nr:YdcF family protein [Marinicauda salina]PWE16346.1 YdcF family protein [Marinicauda salina]
MNERALGMLRLAAFAVTAGLVIGFALFVREATTHGPSSSARGDAIVALTGGEDRVATAVGLLESGRGERLLISGAHPDSAADAVRAAVGGSPALFECCVDFDTAATDTLSNAAQTARWARSHDYGRLVVVTSDYHMPRALLELHAAMPEAELVAYAVRGPAPWSDARAARRWVQEFFKYAAVYARVGGRRASPQPAGR